MQKLEELRKLNKEELYRQYYEGKKIEILKEFRDSYDTYQNAINNLFTLTECISFYEGFHHALVMMENEREDKDKGK